MEDSEGTDETYVAVIRRDCPERAAVTAVRVPIAEAETKLSGSGETAYRLGRTTAPVERRNQACILLGETSEAEPDTTVATAGLFDHHPGLSAVCWLNVLTSEVELTTRGGTWLTASTADRYGRRASQPSLHVAPPAVYDTLLLGQLGELAEVFPERIEVHLFGHAWWTYTVTIMDVAATAVTPWDRGGSPGHPHGRG